VGGDAIGVAYHALLFAILGKPRRPGGQGARRLSCAHRIARRPACVVPGWRAVGSRTACASAFHQRADTVATNRKPVSRLLQFLHAIERFFVTSGTSSGTVSPVRADRVAGFSGLRTQLEPARARC